MLVLPLIDPAMAEEITLSRVSTRGVADNKEENNGRSPQEVGQETVCKGRPRRRATPRATASVDLWAEKFRGRVSSENPLRWGRNG